MLFAEQLKLFEHQGPSGERVLELYDCDSYSVIDQRVLLVPRSIDAMVSAHMLSLCLGLCLACAEAPEFCYAPL